MPILGREWRKQYARAKDKRAWLKTACEVNGWKWHPSYDTAPEWSVKGYVEEQIYLGLFAGRTINVPIAD